MQGMINNLQGYTVQATDGDVGKVDTIYFDDETWAVRYLVVNVGNWLLTDQVLLSPLAVTRVNPDDETISVSLTRKQVENSPDVDTQKPVGRQQEIALHNFYGWDPYWLTAPTYSDGLTAVDTPHTLRRNQTQAEPDIATQVEEPKTNLRSSNEVEGYYIQASDGEIGHVEKFLVDTEFWLIRYLVIDTRNWLPGKKVVVSPDWIENIDWASSEVTIGMTRDQVKASPEYDKQGMIDRAYEQRLYDHYDEAVYWQKAEANR